MSSTSLSDAATAYVTVPWVGDWVVPVMTHHSPPPESDSTVNGVVSDNAREVGDRSGQFGTCCLEEKTSTCSLFDHSRCTT